MKFVADRFRESSFRTMLHAILDAETCLAQFCFLKLYGLEEAKRE